MKTCEKCGGKLREDGDAPCPELVCGGHEDGCPDGPRCVHGSLKRACNECENAERIADLERQLAEARERMKAAKVDAGLQGLAARKAEEDLAAANQARVDAQFAEERMRREVEEEKKFSALNLRSLAESLAAARKELAFSREEKKFSALNLRSLAESLAAARKELAFSREEARTVGKMLRQSDSALVDWKARASALAEEAVVTLSDAKNLVADFVDLAAAEPAELEKVIAEHNLDTSAWSVEGRCAKAAKVEPAAKPADEYCNLSATNDGKVSFSFSAEKPVETKEDANNG